MSDEIGPEKDYQSSLSWYLSKAGKSGLISDIAAVILLITTVMLVLGMGVAGIPALRLWIASIALFAASRGVARVTTPEVQLTKNGHRVEVIKDDADIHARCDEHDCDSTASQHVRAYDVFYIAGYEISRDLTEDTQYCDEHYGEHYPLDGLAPEEDVERVVEYEHN